VFAGAHAHGKEVLFAKEICQLFDLHRRKSDSRHCLDDLLAWRLAIRLTSMCVRCDDLVNELAYDLLELAVILR